MWRQFLACFIVIGAGGLFLHNGLIDENTFGISLGSTFIVIGAGFLTITIKEFYATWRSTQNVWHVLRD